MSWLSLFLGWGGVGPSFLLGVWELALPSCGGGWSFLPEDVVDELFSWLGLALPFLISVSFHCVSLHVTSNYVHGLHGIFQNHIHVINIKRFVATFGKVISGNARRIYSKSRAVGTPLSPPSPSSLSHLACIAGVYPCKKNGGAPN